jgi:hypothetical protein
VIRTLEPNFPHRVGTRIADLRHIPHLGSLSNSSTLTRKFQQFMYIFYDGSVVMQVSDTGQLSLSGIAANALV